MVKKSFILVGAPASSAQEIDVDLQNTFEVLQYNVAQHFSIAEPSGESSEYSKKVTLIKFRDLFPDKQRWRP